MPRHRSLTARPCRSARAFLGIVDFAVTFGRRSEGGTRPGLLTRVAGPFGVPFCGFPGEGRDVQPLYGL